jgi:hypothetical protein
VGLSALAFHGDMTFVGLIFYIKIIIKIPKERR